MTLRTYLNAILIAFLFLGFKGWLPDGGDTFVPGLIGVTYQVESGSQFSFVISGDEVSGVLTLIGTPISGPGSVDLYNGTFSGTRR